MMEYSEDFFFEKEDANISECLNSLENPAMTWIQASGVNDPALISAIGTHFKIHGLVLEDIMSTGQRSKLDEYNNQIFIVSRMLFFDAQKELHDEQISLIFGPNYLISFLETDDPIFKSIRERIRQGNNRIRKSGGDYLAYALLDTVVDHYFNVLEVFDNELVSIEDQVTSQPKPNTLQKIQTIRTQVIHLRKAVWPMREVLNRFQYMESPLVQATTKLYLRDVYDHTVQTIDIIEGFRDIISGMLDLYMSNINMRLNEIVKVLTIVSTIFVPLTFLSSLYGMNFDYMPELQTEWGYPITIIVMLAIACGMLYFFRRRKWI